MKQLLEILETLEFLVPSLAVGAGVLAYGIAYIVDRNLDKRRRTSLEKAMASFRATLIGFGIASLGSLFLLPSTPSLSTFGYPDSAAEIAKTEDLLRLLQQYNDALVRITSVFHWWLFFLVIFLIPAAINLAYAFRKERWGSHPVVTE